MPVVRYVGLAPETSFNQVVPPAAAFHVDITSSSLDAPTETEMVYEGGLGRAARTRRPGFYSPAGNLVYAFDIKTIGFLLRWALGGYNFTVGVGEDLNLHKIHGDNDRLLPSFCARVGKDLFEHVFSGCVINSLEIVVEGEFCQATADIICAKDSRAEIKQIQDLLLPGEYPMAFHEVTAHVNASDVSTKVKSMTLSIENNLDAETGRSVGSRFTRRIIANERVIQLTKELWYEDTATLQQFWGGADGPTTQGTNEFAAELKFNSGVHGSMDIILPRLIYNSVQQQPSGRDEIVQSTEARCLVGVAEGIETDILINLQNNQGEMI